MNIFNTETGTELSTFAARFGKSTKQRIEEIKRILTKLRDALLPKLMFSEFRIKG